MPQKVKEGGNRYLGTAGWLELAAADAVVVMRRVRQMEDFKGDKGDVPQINADIYVVAPAKRAGEFWPDQNVINRGITNKLEGEADGAALAARLVVLKNGANRYPAANPTSEAEDGAIEKAYAALGLKSDDDDAFFRLARERYQQAERADVTNGARAANAADDDEPPF
jgi:hypothetical protein